MHAGLFMLLGPSHRKKPAPWFPIEEVLIDTLFSVAETKFSG
jgi:hypothetical protein